MSDVPPIADAVLYEGHLLYPYRPSALKNQHRYPFGTLYPQAFCDAHAAGDSASLELQCLVLGGVDLAIEVRLRFLQGDVIRDVPATGAFAFPPVRGRVQSALSALRAGVHKLCVSVSNDADFADAGTRTRDDALLAAIVSPHLLLRATGGVFASTIDPPAEVATLGAACRSRGTWPVLLGTAGSNTSDRLLAAPIILYDYPQVAAESPGDFFDGTEIDELLTLRMLTLSDAEKREIAAAGGPGKAILERTERLGIGATVRLHPSCRADILDLALAGKEGTVRAIERDYEGRTYLAVTLNDDPGQDLGAFGHRFFMRPDEVEPV